MTWHLSELGEVRPLSRRGQSKKGWKHLLDPLEDWDALVEANLNAVREDLSWTHGWPEPPDRGVRTLERLHESSWKPAYGEELTHPDSLVGVNAKGVGFAATPRGVFLVIKGGRLASVYRPHPPNRRVVFTEEQFATQAAWKWNDRMGRVHTSNQLDRDLADAGDVWLLAVALHNLAGVANPEALASARARLDDAPVHMRVAATPDPEAMVDAIQAGFDDVDDEEVAQLLEGLADALAVTAVLVNAQAAVALLDQLLGVLAWAPPAWTEVAQLSAWSAQRPGVVGQFWRRADDVLTAAQLSGAHPAPAPVVPLWPGLLQPTWLQATLERFEVAASQLLDAAQAGVRVRATALGSARSYAVRVEPGDYQLWGFDAGTPEGFCVTHLVPDSHVWTLEAPDYEAALLRVTGAPPTSDLERAVAAPGALVEVVRVSRPT